RRRTLRDRARCARSARGLFRGRRLGAGTRRGGGLARAARVACLAAAPGCASGAPVDDLTVRGDFVAARIRLRLGVQAGDVIRGELPVLRAARIVLQPAVAPARLGSRFRIDWPARARIQGLALRVVGAPGIHARGIGLEEPDALAARIRSSLSRGGREGSGVLWTAALAARTWEGWRRPPNDGDAT